MSIGISESADTSPATSMPNASTSPVLALVYPAGKHSLQFVEHYNMFYTVESTQRQDKENDNKHKHAQQEFIMRFASTVAWWELMLNLKFQIVRYYFSAHIWLISFKSSAAKTVTVSSRSSDKWHNWQK